MGKTHGESTVAFPRNLFFFSINNITFLFFPHSYYYILSIMEVEKWRLVLYQVMVICLIKVSFLHDFFFFCLFSPFFSFFIQNSLLLFFVFLIFLFLCFFKIIFANIFKYWTDWEFSFVVFFKKNIVDYYSVSLIRFLFCCSVSPHVYFLKLSLSNLFFQYWAGWEFSFVGFFKKNIVDYYSVPSHSFF